MNPIPDFTVHELLALMEGARDGEREAGALTAREERQWLRRQGFMTSEEMTDT